MATTNQLSTNAYEILYNSSDTGNSILAALQAVFTAKGYTPLNAGAVSVSAATASRPPAASMVIGSILSAGYTAPNADGFSSKPVIAEVQTSGAASYLQLATAESVSYSSTNGLYTYTNAPWQQFVVSPISIALLGLTKAAFSRILLFVSSRYAMIQHKSDTGVLSEWHGIFEIAREFSGNNSALSVPTHCLINSYLMRYSFDATISTACNSGITNYTALGAGVGGPINLCRTRNGAVGQAASCGVRIMTSNGEVGFNGITYPTAASNGIVVGKRFQDVLPSASNPWNGKNWATNLGVLSDTDQAVGFASGAILINLNTLTAPSYIGKIYGLKGITTGVGSTLDQISMPVDANGFIDAGGTATTHYVVSGLTGARFVLPQ